MHRGGSIFSFAAAASWQAPESSKQDCGASALPFRCRLRLVADICYTTAKASVQHRLSLPRSATTAAGRFFAREEQLVTA